MADRSPKLWGALAGNFLAEATLRIPAFIWDAWAARRLTKREFGVWIGFRLILQVTPYFQGLTLFGLDLRYSHLVGAGEYEKARRTAGAALISTTLCTSLLLLLLSPGLIFEKVRNAMVPGSAPAQIALLMGIAFAQTFYAVVGTHLRNRLRFHAMNLGLLFGNTVGMAVLFLLLPSLRVYGCLIAFSVMVLVCTLSWLRHIDLVIPDRHQIWSEFRELAKLGLPLIAAGGVLDGLRLLGRWFVAHSRGVEALGTYGVAYVFSGIVFLAGTSSSRVLVQFMGRAEGAKLSREFQAVRYLFAPGLAVAAVGSLSASLVWVGAQWFLPWWAPAQAAALVVLRPAIYGALPFSVAYLYMTLLRAQGRLRELIVVTGGTFVGYVVALGAVAAAAASLRTFVTTEATGFAVVAVVLVGWTGQSLGSRRWWFLGILVTIFGATVLGMEIGTRAAVGAQTPLRGVGIQLACNFLALAVWGPVAWLALRRLLGEVREHTDEDVPSPIAV
ncbi:MAG: hypothetical protein ACRENE_29075 [Polyangiaceae bacterium]